MRVPTSFRLQEELNKARREIESGQCVKLSSHEDIDNYFASLWYMITAHDRILYEIHDETIKVLVLDVEGHYNDK